MVVEWRTILLGLVDDLVIAILVGITLTFFIMEGILSLLLAIILGIASFLIISIIAYKSTIALLMKPKVGGSLIGKQGIALTELKPTGIVLVEGEHWQAVSQIEIKKGGKIVVIKSNGLKLTVVPINQENNSEKVENTKLSR